MENSGKILEGIPDRRIGPDGYMRDGKAVLIDPDLDFIESLSSRVGDVFKRCMQCGTCSAACAISPDNYTFPAKEMAWANWGMKDRLLADADVWLCYQCTDCSTRCPRGARPGDVLAAARQESIINYAFPRFLGRWVSRAQYIPLLLGIPAVLLTLALYLKMPIENALGISRYSSDEILYSYTSMFPHWLLNVFFGIISLFVLLAAVIGVRRFWGAMSSADGVGQSGIQNPGLFRSILKTFKKIITHERFTNCTAANSRTYSHICVFFGFAALTVVTLWIITSGINPLIRTTFVYPFSFWSPWKLLANLGGLALLSGLLLMMRDRLKDRENAPLSTYFDWSLIAMLFAVVITGFITEVLHYVRLEPHRHVAYFAHLVLACGLLMYLPYSKFAHLIYRSAAMVFSEYRGRDSAEATGTLTGVGAGTENVERPSAGETETVGSGAGISPGGNP